MLNSTNSALKFYIGHNGNHLRAKYNVVYRKVNSEQTLSHSLNILPGLSDQATAIMKIHEKSFT